MRANVLFAVTRWLATIGFIVSVARAEEVIETVMEGSAVTLTAEFDPAVGPIYYQWSKDGVTLPDERGPTLRFAPVQISDAGAYIVYVSNAGGTANSAPALLRVSALNPSRLSHFSLIAAGSPLIIGFALGGGNAAATPFLIRAAGPALEQFGVETFMHDPKLQVFNTGAAIAENDNWLDSSNLTAARTKVAAFAFSTGSLDSALLLTVGAKSYTAQISESGGARSSALFELFDLGSTATPENPRLVNISARVVIAPDDPTVIAGFTIRGHSPLRILARAIGPTLASFGVSAPLPDPTLTLYRGQTVIAANDNWRDSGAIAMTAAARQAGAFELPLDSRDAALVGLLAPGSYTLRVGATGNIGGETLIELYELP